MKSNAIKDAFTAAMKKAGFQKKSDGWYLDADDAILVANLQKSDDGDQYYVNLAVWLKALGEVAFPKEYQCHIRMRAWRLEPEQRKYLEGELFNLENPEISDATRRELVRSFLETKAIPFLRSCSTLRGLKQLYRENRLKGAAIMVRAQQILQN